MTETIMMTKRKDKQGEENDHFAKYVGFDKSIATQFTKMKFADVLIIIANDKEKNKTKNVALALNFIEKIVLKLFFNI